MHLGKIPVAAALRLLAAPRDPLRPRLQNPLALLVTIAARALV
jgi:hypothetical protein